MNTARARSRIRRTCFGLVLAAVSVATFSPTVRAQTPTLRPGKYEKTSETAIQGRPAKNPPRKDVICLNEPDLRDLTNTALSDDGQKSCKVSNYAVAGTTATFTRTCAARDGNTYVVDMTMTFTSPESYRGVAKIKSISGGPMKVLEGATTTTTAKRIGECTK